MENIINQVYKYFNRYPEHIFNRNNLDWKSIKKELDRVNIKSMVVSISIDKDSKLIFPLLVKHELDKGFRLIKGLTKEGLQSAKEIISYSEFEKSYSNEFMLLEKANFIHPNDSYVRALYYRHKVLISFSILVALVLFILFNSSGHLINIFVTITGLLLSFYIKTKESNGKIKSPICIDKGIFSCDKSKTYGLFGIAFSTLGIIYFIGTILNQIGSVNTYSYIGISTLGLFFCIYSFAIQIFKEKKYAFFVYSFYSFSW